MLNRILFITLFVASSCLIKAQLTAPQLFVSMPDSLCPYFDMRTRLLMVEYFNESVHDSVENVYDGKSCVINKTDKYIKVHVADGFTMELIADTTSFYLIQTACAPICSSIVKHYFDYWQYIGEIKPDEDGLFMQAIVVDNQINWEDQTPLMLDEQEKQHYFLR